MRPPLSMRPAAFIVGTALERGQLRERVGLALKWDLCAGQQFFIGLRQVVFLLQFRNDLGREGFELDLGVFEIQRAELGLKAVPMGVFQEGERKFLHIFLKFGHFFVEVFLLAVIKSVPRVNGMADADQGSGGFKMTQERVHFQKSSARFFIAVRSFQPGNEPGNLLFHGLKVRAFVGHFGKFHFGFLLQIKRKNFHLCLYCSIRL